MMSAVLDRLEASDDPLECDMAATLREWQDAKRRSGRKATLGYEPKTINMYGVVEVICRRVKKGSVGFGEVGPDHSYEALVVRYPDRFPKEILSIARDRLNKAGYRQG